MAGAGPEENSRFAGFTYIRTLLALELGDSIISGSSEATDLNSKKKRKNSVSSIGTGPLVVGKVIMERGLAYLRHGGDEAGGHTDGPQALTSSREVSGGEHREQNPSGEGIKGN